MHDAQRPIEQKIVEEMYVQKGGAVDSGSEEGRKAPANLLRLVVFNP